MKNLKEIKVAIVGDNYFYSKLIYHSIKENYNQIDFFYDTESILKANFNYDVILLDNDINDGGGVALSGLIKEVCSKAKIIMLATSFDVDSIVNYLSANINDLVTKDFGTLENLVESIENVVRKKKLVELEFVKN